MKIWICIKQVPGSSNVEVDPKTGVLLRDGASTRINPYDLYAIEFGIRLRQQGDCVGAITMGPPQASKVLEEAIAMGVDKGVLLSDRRFAGADVLATSFTLAQGVRKLGEGDIILCGKQTTDGDTAQVGPELAEHLGIVHIANVQEATWEGTGQLRVKSLLDDVVMTQMVKTPCLLCLDGNINTPRLPSYKRRKALRKEQITVWSLDDMEDQNPGSYGMDGSPTKVERIFPPNTRKEKEVWQEDGPVLGERLYQMLRSRKFI